MNAAHEHTQHVASASLGSDGASRVRTAGRRGGGGVVLGLVAGLALGGSASMMVAASHHADAAGEALAKANAMLNAQRTGESRFGIAGTGAAFDGLTITASDHDGASGAPIAAPQHFAGRYDHDRYERGGHWRDRDRWDDDRDPRDHRRAPYQDDRRFRSWLDDQNQYFVVPRRFKIDEGGGRAWVENVDLWVRPAGRQTLEKVGTFDRD